MADFVPLSCRVNFKLTAGTNPNTGNPITRTVSIPGVMPSVPAANLKAVEVLLSPCFEYPVSEVQLSLKNLVESL